jgi:hypothetical protein
MESAQILNGFRQRTPWQTMKAILKANTLPVGQGWEKTINLLQAYSTLQRNWPNKYLTLHKQYKEHLSVGEKALQFFKLDKQHIEKLIDFFLSYEPEETPFHETYPFPLKQEQLKDINSAPMLVSIENQDSYIALVFCSKRVSIKQEAIGFESLNEDAKKDFASFDKLIAFKKEIRQCFDVVAISKEGDNVEVRIDIFNQMNSSDEKGVAFYQTIYAFNSLVEKVLSIDSILKRPINLFSLIDNLYSSTEGRICEIGFTTDEGSIKSEKMRRTKGDLRTETYHKAGKLAVGYIGLYRLGIIWKTPLSDVVETEPEVLLPGRVSALSVPQPQLDYLLITNCSGSIDYNLIMSILLKYLEDDNE